MAKRILDRRAFLREAAATAASVAVIAGVPTIVADNGAWAMSLGSMSTGEAEALLRMTRLIFPHDSLGDVYYATVVEELDAKVAKDPALAETVKLGVAELDQAMGVPWLRLSEGAQVEVLRKIESGPFFQGVKGHAVVALYNNKLLWPQFGYQGSSFEHGGYLLRGFQDAGWTLEPDAEASPAAFTG
jgi:hypothetical protein